MMHGVSFKQHPGHIELSAQMMRLRSLTLITATCSDQQYATTFVDSLTMGSRRHLVTPLRLLAMG